jgi:hypothetical protein
MLFIESTLQLRAAVSIVPCFASLSAYFDQLCPNYKRQSRSQGKHVRLARHEDCPLRRNLVAPHVVTPCRNKLNAAGQQRISVRETVPAQVDRFG